MEIGLSATLRDLKFQMKYVLVDNLLLTSIFWQHGLDTKMSSKYFCWVHFSGGFFLIESHGRSVKRALTKIGTTTTTNNHIKTKFSLSLASPQNTVFKVTKMTRRVKNSISNEDYTQLLLHLYLRNEISLMWYSHSEIFLVFPILKLLIQSSDLNSNSCLWQNYLY